MRWVVLSLALIVACTADEPSVDTWVEQQWQPITALVPEPGNATPEVCETALGTLRDRASELDPAPTEVLAEAAHGWLQEAESLMFSCVSVPDFDYTAGYESLAVREAEVDAVLEGP